MGKSATPLTRRQRERKAQAEAHPVAWVLRQLVPQSGILKGSSTRWLELLNDRAADHLKQSRAWPTTANQLGVLFGELSEGLQLLGVVLSFQRFNGVRLWRCETQETVVQRRHFEATKPEREVMRKAREREERQLIRAARASLKPHRAPKRRKTN